jgi:hypothetical protein
MITVPQTPITDTSFQRWKAHKVEGSDGESTFHYYVIPLIDVDEEELSYIEDIPTLFSSDSDTLKDSKGNTIYTMRLFDDDLPELQTEEEVEILFKLLTKREITL